VSFDLVSFAAGLTKMSFWGFLVATIVGAALATFVYSFLGEQAPQYVDVLLVVFGALIAFAVVVAIVRRRARRARSSR
jgi:uncharacterized membrane protein YdjX (TVP38/TMEM64 family)